MENNRIRSKEGQQQNLRTVSVSHPINSLIGKREFYNQNKEEQNTNLQLKTDLCMQAEALKDSTEWKKNS